AASEEGTCEASSTDAVVIALVVSPSDGSPRPCSANWVNPMAEPKSEDDEQDAASPQATTTPKTRLMTCLLLFPWPATTGSSKNNNHTPRKSSADGNPIAANVRKLQVTEPN